MYFVSFCNRFIDRFARCVLFRRAKRAHQFTVTLTCTNANETVAIDVLVVVYNKTWENRVMLSLHGQLMLDIRPRCWLRMLKLTRLRLVNFYHPQSTSLPNIQHYLIMTRWITLQYSKALLCYTHTMKLCCLTIPNLNKDIQFYVWPYTYSIPCLIIRTSQDQTSTLSAWW